MKASKECSRAPKREYTPRKYNILFCYSLELHNTGATIPGTFWTDPKFGLVWDFSPGLMENPMSKQEQGQSSFTFLTLTNHNKHPPPPHTND